MAIEEKWRIYCDEPSCFDEYEARDEMTVREKAIKGDYQLTDDGRWFCPEHHI